MAAARRGEGEESSEPKKPVRKKREQERNAAATRAWMPTAACRLDVAAARRLDSDSHAHLDADAVPAWTLTTTCSMAAAAAHSLDADRCARLEAERRAQPAVGASTREGVETTNYLILECSFSQDIWSRLQINTSSRDVAALWELPQPQAIPAEHYNMFLLMICWFFWKHQNDVVFNSLSPCHGRLKSALVDAAPLWRHHLPPASAAVVDSWCSLISENM
ncbi:hypothetical protein BS78_05G272100 [Paspalum vaginatum]|uniref:Reverse transcriptase zinc-binding domain-containing protein n=1 Tax=Paspalum vaginatum TaxID=158149 RepID=A0A9W7X5N1_9POAL|nr:hypothetical protein BS78_K235800 [Paspalum vaginatum]KAJ1277145.1 hypothetical protein BS78_05G272100 [Paspalum vaginatum]